MGGVIIDGSKLPRVGSFNRSDMDLFIDLHKVFAKHGLKGRIISVEFGCGMPPIRPPRLPIRCFRVCVPGPRDEPRCTWVCY